MSSYLLVLDEGTTDRRPVRTRIDGRIGAAAADPALPEPGEVEHDAAEIWASTSPSPVKWSRWPKALATSPRSESPTSATVTLDHSVAADRNRLVW
jgi:hypothetical protein